MPKRSSKAAPSSALKNGLSDLMKEFWPAADALRNNMDAAEYKHMVR